MLTLFTSELSLRTKVQNPPSPPALSNESPLAAHNCIESCQLIIAKMVSAFLNPGLACFVTLTWAE